MPILWWIEIFTGSGKFPSDFNPQFWGKFRGCFCIEISKRFLCSLQQMIHVDKTTCLSSSEFHRGYQESARVLVHFLPIVDIRWILPWFSLFLGISSGCLPQISPSPSPCKYDWLMTLRSGKGGRKKEPNWKKILPRRKWSCVMWPLKHHQSSNSS